MIAGNEPGPTRWLAVLCLFVAGCTTALHVGKVPSALPSLRELWQLSLSQTGLIISVYSVMIATAGFLLGVLVQRAGYTRFTVLGVVLVGLGSFLGSYAEGLSWMLMSRAFEGLGWIIAAIAIPTLLAALSHPSDRALVMGIWGAFVPVGAGVMLLISPEFLAIGGWQFSWHVAGYVSMVGGLLSVWVVYQNRDVLKPLKTSGLSRDFSDLRKSLVWVLSGCFLIYSFQFAAVTSFLPTLLVETTQLPLSTASRITAFVIMCNAIGNVAAGAFMRKGMSHRPLLIAGALCMGLSVTVIFSSWLPAYLRVLCAFSFSIGGGLIPGALFATMPKVASATASVGLLIGLMMQFTGIGQLLGGVAFPATVEAAGNWRAGGYLGFACGILGALLATRSALAPRQVVASAA